MRHKRYHYTECGLDNVYLENVEVRVCPACGLESPRIRSVDTHALFLSDVQESRATDA
jgi:hypothetical protein